MNIVPYLWFNGTCGEAFRFYEKALGGKIVDMLPHRETPMSADVPADWQDKIMHASMRVGDAVLMGSDVPPAHYRPAQGLSVSLHVTTAEEAERAFKALSEGGSVTMPIEKNLLGGALRHARRPVRDAVDDQLRTGPRLRRERLPTRRPCAAMRGACRTGASGQNGRRSCPTCS